MNFEDWPKPQLNVEFFQNKRKIYTIIRALQDAGYNVDSVRGIIDVIEHNHIDISKFDFPYCSFDVFKEHTLIGEFDIDVEKRLATPEQIAAYKQDIKDKNLWERS